MFAEYRSTLEFRILVVTEVLMSVRTRDHSNTATATKKQPGRQKMNGDGPSHSRLATGAAMEIRIHQR
jgi:hypothetical protein